jgi:hypothetical protein
MHSHVKSLILVNPIGRVYVTVATYLAVQSARRPFILFGDCTANSLRWYVRLRCGDTSFFSLRASNGPTSIICLRTTLYDIRYLLGIILWDCINTTCHSLLKLIPINIISFTGWYLFSFIFTLNLVLNSGAAEQVWVLGDIVVIIKWLKILLLVFLQPCL